MTAYLFSPKKNGGPCILCQDNSMSAVLRCPYFFFKGDRARDAAPQFVFDPFICAY